MPAVWLSAGGSLMLVSYHACRRPPPLRFSHRAKRGPEVLFDIQIEHKAQPCVSVSEVKTYAEPPISCSPKKRDLVARRTKRGHMPPRNAFYT